MRLIDVILGRTDDSEDYIMDCCCPSDYGPEYEPYESECARRTCEECWEQEFLEGGQTQ